MALHRFTLRSFVQAIQIPPPPAFAFWRTARQISARIFFKSTQTSFGTKIITLAIESGRLRGRFGGDRHATDRINDFVRYRLRVFHGVSLLIGS